MNDAAKRLLTIWIALILGMAGIAFVMAHVIPQNGSTVSHSQTSSP